LNAQTRDIAVAEAAAQPLDELMLAMDVVDTLRHRELVLQRELEADDRDHRLLERLREIYESQGIAVTDDVLAQGVRALREERFAYTGPRPSVARTLATLYATRARWGKWVAGAGGIAILAVLIVQLAILGPARRELAELPADLASAHQAVVAVADVPAALTQAQAAFAAGEAAVAAGDRGDARSALAELEALRRALERQYTVRIVSRPGEYSGVWRVPENNEQAQNFYLIVEATAPDGTALELPVVNEESGETERVRRFGLRVDRQTFDRIVADKSDDGIIQQAVVGEKPRGALDPVYSIETTGGTITRW
jgi:hypothetical protein